MGLTLCETGRQCSVKFRPGSRTNAVRLVSPIARLYLHSLPHRHLQGILGLLAHHQSQRTLQSLRLTLRKSDVPGIQREGYATTRHHTSNNQQNTNMCAHVCDSLGVCVWGCVTWSNGVTFILIMRSTVVKV